MATTLQQVSEVRPEALRQRVLVVDDNEDNRELFATVLRGGGYQVVTACDGVEALTEVDRQVPDLIVLDLMMPNLNGYEVTERVKNNPHLPFIPIIIVTAKSDLRDKIRGLEMGVDDYLVKPVNYPELLARVRSLLRLKRTQDALTAERNKIDLLYQVSNALNDSLDVDRVLSKTIEMTVDYLSANKGSILLLDQERRVVRFLLARAYLPAEERKSVVNQVLDSGLGGWVARHAQGAVITDTDTDDRWVHFPDDPIKVGSAVSVPMMSGGEVGGVLTLVHPDKGHFQAGQLDLLTAIASQVMIAARNAYRHTEVVEEKQRTEAILSNLAEVLLTTDQATRLTNCNPAALHLLGASRTQVIGLEVAQLLAEEEGRLASVLHTVLSSGQQVVGMEMSVIVPANGSRVPMLVSCDALRDAGGRVTGCVVAMADITKLREAAALREEFVHMISHDLRGPITGIFGCLDMIADPSIGAVNPVQQNFVQMAIASCNSLNNLIGDMLDVYKLEAGQMQLALRPLDLNDMIAEVVSQMQGAAAERGLYLKAVPGGGKLTVYGDRTKLARVFSNLISNALKFTETGGLTISSGRMDDGMVEVRVRDTGIGIPSDAGQKIFDKFYQVQNRKAGHMAGTGLGLTFCKQVVEAQGGRMWVDSVQGKGSTFIFTIPTVRLAKTTNPL